MINGTPTDLGWPVTLSVVNGYRSGHVQHFVAGRRGHVIVAVYSGDSNFSGSSSTV